MRASKYFYKTYKEVPKEAQTPSHILMHRAGMIQKLSSGIYNYLPLALKSLKKIEKIIREELDKQECQEVLMPAVQPGELWEESGRWKYYGPELLRFKDRKNADYCLGPTHEEVITDMVRRQLTSYKQLPLNLYQIQTKFRDEIRPRFGLMRGREFIMKDGYSFDTDEEASRISYDKMYEAYNAIFNRCGLRFRAVDAATGAIGGDMSHEFQVLAETGEDIILSCTKCSYSANLEKAVSKNTMKPGINENQSDLDVQISEIFTPGKKTIDDITEFLKLDSSEMLKTIIYTADEKPFAVVVRGDNDVNEAKLQAFLNVNMLLPADDKTVQTITAAETGFAGPVNLKEKISIIADNRIYAGADYVCGANRTDYHLSGIDPVRDFPQAVKADISFAAMGEECPDCDGKLEQNRGIEVGQIFYLGKKYSQPMGCTFLSSEGKEQTAVMGCYGIGVSRTMAAAIEQNHDENGIIWPASIAPFEIVVIPLQTNNPDVVEAAENIYSALVSHGLDVMLDDRNERAGFKLNDADLLGYPLQIICGARTVEKGCLELKARKTGDKIEVPLGKAAEEALNLIKTL